VRKGVLAIVIVMLLLATSLAVYLILQMKSPSEENFIIVTDALGRSVNITLPINRVIISGKSAWPITTVAYMFPNAKNVLYGLSENINVTLFQTVDPNITSKIVSTAAAEPNVEEIVAMDPDVVILKTLMKSTIGDSLEELGIKVVYVDFETLDSYLRDTKVLGKIFMDEKRAEEIVDYYNETCHSILSKIPPSGEREKVLLLYYSAKGGTISFNVPGEGWLQTFMIETAGGYPLSKELPGTGWNTVSFEQIATWNPDIIFVVTYSKSPTANDVKTMLLNNVAWSDISAVKNRKVYAVPHDCGNVAALGSWDCPGSRWILGLKWMAKKIKPSLFSNLDIANEAKTFYMEMYGLDENDANIVVNGISGDL
jgi:iron complex transport system substrate-binding protein